MHESLRSKHNDRILPGLGALERESELLEGPTRGGNRVGCRDLR